MGARSHLWLQPADELPKDPHHGEHCALKSGGYFIYDGVAGIWRNLFSGQAVDRRPWHLRVIARWRWLFGF